MFLTPQHFQTQDRFFEESLQFRLSTANFANWGVTRLVVDTESLANGSFAVQECRGVLPDGLCFSLPEVDDLPLSRDIAEHFPPTQEKLDVFLAIPARRASGKNVTLPSSKTEGTAAQMATRYLAETRMVTDETGGVEEKPVQMAKASFRLLFGDESLDGITAMRIAQVMRNTAGTFVLNSGFIAPCLDFASSEYLMRLVRRQIEILAARSNALIGARAHQGKSLLDLTTSDVANFWLLHTINSHLPLLKHLWAVRRGHPEHLFARMLQLAGALSSFSDEPEVPDFQDYDHDNLGPCFLALDERLRRYVESGGGSAKYAAVQLQQTTKSIWSGNVVEDHYFQDSQFFLSVSARMGVNELIREVAKRIKVASPNEIQQLVRKALPGLALSHAPTPPASLPINLGSQYFTLNQNGPLWEGIVASRSLSIFVPSEIADPKLEVLIVFE